MKLGILSTNMTDRQIVADCRPKLKTYKTTQGLRPARSCLFCGEIIRGKFRDLEQHARIKHV